MPPKQRSRRARGVPRARTLAVKKITREELMRGALENPPVDVARPRTREECRGEARPCPWVACKHHLAIDVNQETGSIRLVFPDRDIWELAETCSLDVADRGVHTLEQVGELTNLTRERTRQIEVQGLLKIRAAEAMRGVGDEDAA